MNINHMLADPTFPDHYDYYYVLQKYYKTKLLGTKAKPPYLICYRFNCSNVIFVMWGQMLSCSKPTPFLVTKLDMTHLSYECSSLYIDVCHLDAFKKARQLLKFLQTPTSIFLWHINLVADFLLLYKIPFRSQGRRLCENKWFT